MTLNKYTSNEISITKFGQVDSKLTPIIKKNAKGISKSTISTDISTAYFPQC